MNRKFFASALSVLLLSGTAALATNQQMETSGEKKTSTSSATAKSGDHEFIGTVKEFEAGKMLKVLVGKKIHTFNLDAKGMTATVDPSVAVGSKVKVVESKAADGSKTLAVTPEG